MVKKKGKNVVEVLGSKSFSSIKSSLPKKCQEECIFIDTISKSNGANVIYISPSNLTGISIAVNQAAQSLQEKPSIIFNSISSLFNNNNPSMLIKFISFLVSRAQVWKADLFFVFSEEGLNTEVISVLKESADKVIKK